MEQGSAEWFEARVGKITASRAWAAMEWTQKDTPKAEYLKYRAELIAERLSGKPFRHFVTRAMEDGAANEEYARDLYELETGNTVQRVGFIQHPELDYFGASPDGKIDAETVGGLEIKCLTMANHIAVFETDEIDHKYTAQIQAGVECTGWEWWHYVGYSPDYQKPYDFRLLRFDRDEEFIKRMLMYVTRLHEDVSEAVEKLRSRFAA